MEPNPTSPLTVGDGAPDFTIDGVHSLERLTKGPLVVVFVSSLDHAKNPLIAWRPWLKYAPHFRARGAFLLGIVVGGDVAPQELSTLFPIVHDAEGRIATQFGLSIYNLLPATFMLQPPGQSQLSIPTEIAVGDEQSVTEYSCTLSMESANLSTVSYAFCSEKGSGTQAEPMEMLQKLPALTPKSKLSLKYKLELFYAQQLLASPQSPLIRDLRSSRTRILASDVMQTAKKTGDDLSAAACDLAFQDPVTKKDVSLRKLTAKGGCVVLTYFLDSQHAICKQSLEAWRKHTEALRKRGATHVLAVSANPEAAAARGSDDLTYLLDPHSRVARGALGVATSDDSSPLTATFVLKGASVVYAFVSDDPAQRAEPSAVASAVSRIGRRAANKVKEQSPKKLGPFGRKLKAGVSSILALNKNVSV